MKSTVDKLEGLSRKIKVEIPAEKVQQAFGKVYRAIQKKANIKGFRQGKAPLATIKSIYAESVKNDVINDLISEGYQTALDTHKMEPVGQPRVSFNPINETQEFHFIAEFEVRPEVQLQQYENLKVMREIMEIPQDRAQRILDDLRENKSELIPVFEDRPLAKADVAIIDFSAQQADGQPLPNGAAEGRPLEIGSNQFIPGFEDGLVGMRIGEKRTLNLRFPENYHEASLSGAPVAFDVKLVDMKKKKLPELNDDFAKSVGPFESLDALKARIHKDLEDREQSRIMEDVRNRIIHALVDRNPVEAPKTLVDRQTQSLVEDFKGRMKAQGLGEGDFEEYKKKWNTDFTDTATFMVKSTFLLDALAEKLNLHATQGEVETRIQDNARLAGVDLTRMKEFYKNHERRARLVFQVTEEKVVSYLLSKAEVIEVAKDKLG